MTWKACVPTPVRRLAGHATTFVKRWLPPSPEEIVKGNTREAFEKFFQADAYIARHYLHASRLAFYELVADYCHHLVRGRSLQRPLRVVDIGCGTGHLLAVLRQRLAPSHALELVGMDFARSALRRAQALLPTATWLLEDLYTNTLEADSFDLVLCIETLEHLRQPQRAVGELSRICRPGGSMIVTVPNGEKDSWDGHVNFWTPQAFREFLAPYGSVKLELLQEDSVILAHMAQMAQAPSLSHATGTADAGG